MGRKIVKSNWIVKVNEKVRKEIFCNNCTKEQAEKDPHLYSHDEVEIATMDYEVVSVEENI